MQRKKAGPYCRLCYLTLLANDFAADLRRSRSTILSKNDFFTFVWFIDMMSMVSFVSWAEVGVLSFFPCVLRTDGLNGALYCTAMDLRLHFYCETASTFARNSLLLLLLLVLIILQCTMTIVWPYHGEKKYTKYTCSQNCQYISIDNCVCYCVIIILIM